MDELRLHLGCGRNPMKGWVNIDMAPGPGVDLVQDLDVGVGRSMRLPFQDDSVDAIYAAHFLEHIRNPLPLMQELYRVAKPNAQAVFRVPYGSSDDAFEDPTHVRQLFVHSWGYFSQPYYWRADYGYTADWDTKDIVLTLLESTYERFHGVREEIIHAIQTSRNIVYEMTATLVAHKPPRPPQRELQTPVRLSLERLIEDGGGGG